MSSRGLVWPEIPIHRVELPPGPGPWTNITQGPPYPDRVVVWADGPIQFRLVIGTLIAAGPYNHDPALAPPPFLSVPSSAVVQVRNPAGGGVNVTALVSRDIVANRPTGIA